MAPHENAFREILEGIAADQAAAFNALPQELKDRIGANYMTADERKVQSNRDELLGRWSGFEKDLLPKYKEAYTQVPTLQTQLQQAQARTAELEGQLQVLQAQVESGGGDPAKLQTAIAAIKDDILKSIKSSFVTADQLQTAMKDAERNSVEFIHTRSLPVMQRADALVRQAKEQYGYDLDQARLFETAKAHGNDLESAFRVLIDPIKETKYKADLDAAVRAAEERGFQKGVSERETHASLPEDASSGPSFRQFTSPGAPPTEEVKVPEGYVPGQSDLIGRQAAANYRKAMEAGAFHS